MSSDELLKFTRIFKNGTVFYRFEGFENVNYPSLKFSPNGSNF
jgi:hypothetical protein